ncbi:hypothetical protein [Dactylosporangium sp. CS-033363]|uniref:hypothetical protein n=1 Tax=Dactylosporangium sp. CS-033363 TaxID=3239935 RepID=UPI003D8E1E2F
MDEGRIVLVDDRGTGYLLATRLVLTAGHVAPGIGAAVRLASMTAEFAMTGRVVWKGVSDRLDAALVEIDDGDWPVAGPLRTEFGWLATGLARIEAAIAGFPESAEDNAPRFESGHVTGWINALDQRKSGRYLVHLRETASRERPDGASPWSGLSGAAVLCGGLLTGVVAADPLRGQHAKLQVVQAQALLADAGFREVLRRHGLAGAGLLPVELQDVSERPLPVAPLPASLLLPWRRIVAFGGRDELFAELDAWTQGPKVASWLLYGLGGQGKTRVAAELAHRLAGQGWATVWLRPDAADCSVLAEVTADLLVVVDYAETRAGQVVDVLHTIAGASGRRVRLLMLARTQGEWWDDLRMATGFLARTRTVELLALASNRDSWLTTYRQAVADLAPHLAELPEYAQYAWPPVVERLVAAAEPRSDGVSALTVHMTALADLLDSVDPSAAPPPVGASVEDRVLAHEHRYWNRAATAFGIAPGISEPGLQDVLAAAMLLGAEDGAGANRMLKQLPVLEGQSGDRRNQVRSWIATLYPAADARPWGGLQPDRLAERHAGLRLVRSPELVDALIGDATPGQLKSLVTVYARAAFQPAFLKRLDRPLAELIVRHPEQLAGIAIDVAAQVEAPDPLIRGLRQVAAADGTTVEVLDLLAGHIPETSHNLADLRIDLLRSLAERLRGTGDDPPARARAAVVMRALAASQAAMGMRREALGWAQEAHGLHADLYGMNPDLAAELARTRTVLAERLGDVGDYHEAVMVARHADEAGRTGPAPHPVDRAATLVVLSVCEARVGEFGRALAAAEAAVHGLDHARGDVHAARADALRNLAQRLSAVGRHERGLAAVQDAVEVHGRLAHDRPDAHRLDFAKSLQLHSTLLSAVGRDDAALTAINQATELYRELTKSRPTAYLPDRPAVVNALAGQHAALGELDEALQVTTEALHTHRQLVDLRPEILAADLAAVLVSHADRLAAVGRREEALQSAEDALELLERDQGSGPLGAMLARADVMRAMSRHLNAIGHRHDAVRYATRAVGPVEDVNDHHRGAYTTVVAGALIEVADRFEGIGESEESLRAAERAVGTCRRAAAGTSDAHAPDLARALDVVARQQAKLGRGKEALRSAQEAVQIWRRLGRTWPEAFRSDLAAALHRLGTLRIADGAVRRGLAALGKAVHLRRAAAAAQPAAFAAALADQAARLAAAGRLADGLAAAAEAVAVCRPLAARHPRAFEPDLAAALVAHSDRLAAVGRRHEALEAAQEALGLYRRLAEAEWEAFGPDVAAASITVSDRLAAAGRPEEALQAAHDALRETETHHEHGPEAFRSATAAALYNLALRMAGAGLHRDAVRPAMDAAAMYRELHGRFPDKFATAYGAALAEAIKRARALGDHRMAERLRVDAEALRRPGRGYRRQGTQNT